jgi:hypothetical protein
MRYRLVPRGLRVWRAPAPLQDIPDIHMIFAPAPHKRRRITRKTLYPGGGRRVTVVILHR